MNYHSDEWIMRNVGEHLDESFKYFPESIVGIFLQGSQNYGLDYEDSDIDTKLIVVPTFKDIAMNHQPVSTTHIRENEEHIDFKDIRLYMQTFRKQNLNFLEILFTPYYYISEKYEAEWNRLIERREDIARMNPYQAVKSMQGIAKEKYFAMEHHYPKRMHMIHKYGYDPKQLHHLLRVEEYILRYINGEKYEDCLNPLNPDYLIEVKNGCHNLEEARELADISIKRIDDECLKFFLENPKAAAKEDEEVRALLDDVQYNIMKIAVQGELANGRN